MLPSFRVGAAGQRLGCRPRRRPILGPVLRERARTVAHAQQSALAGDRGPVGHALYLVHYGLNYRLPFISCTIAIALSALLNVVLSIRYPATHRLTNRGATLYLAYDIVQLAALLYLTGGIGIRLH